MKLSERQQIFARNVAKLIDFIFSTGYTCTLGEAYRTAQQAALYAAQGKGIVDSLHCYRLAIDLQLFSLDGIYITDSESYKFLGDYWKTLHPDNGWGGDFSPPRVDGNHFQMSK